MLFYTCANRKYEDFAPLYVAACLHHNQGARCEVGLEDEQAFRAAHADAITVLETHFPNRFMLHTVNFPKRVIPNTVRFITTPLWKAEFVYIGDIDILILEKNLALIHARQMERTGRDFCNSVRPGTKRLSGLHFTRYDAYYPLDGIEAFNLSDLDEHVLYQICLTRRGFDTDDAPWFRPTHGIHMSPNREPFGSVVNGKRRPGWGIAPWTQHYIEFASTPLMQALRPQLSSRLLRSLDLIDSACGQRSPDPV